MNSGMNKLFVELKAQYYYRTICISYYNIISYCPIIKKEYYYIKYVI